MMRSMRTGLFLGFLLVLAVWYADARATAECSAAPFSRDCVSTPYGLRERCYLDPYRAECAYSGGVYRWR